jgi:hypothetical protein
MLQIPPNPNTNMPSSTKMDYRKALLSTEESRAAEKALIFKELEAKNILHKLPRGTLSLISWKRIVQVLITKKKDILGMIWRLLLRRRGTILPGYVQYLTLSDHKAGDHYYVYNEHNYKRYKYQWNELPQKAKHTWSNGRLWGGYEPEYHGGSYGEGFQTVTVTIPTEPTFGQTELIAGGGKTLPFTFNNEFGTQIGCDVVHRGEAGDSGAQVINQIQVHLPRLESLALLQVCKQTLAECSQILYGENTFAFITGSARPHASQHAHQHDEFEHFPHWIPGAPKKNGAPQSQRQTSNAIDRIFRPDTFRPKFVARDPMLDFFHRIGRDNTSLLTKIEIEGCMKTVYNTLPDHPLGAKPLGFARIIPILTTVLKNTSPHLRELTLHMENKNRFKNSWLWDDDPYNNAGKTDEDRIDEAVEQVVSDLEPLEVLNLGNYKSFQRPENEPDWEYEDGWGSSARWMGIVSARAEQKAGEEATKKLEATTIGGNTTGDSTTTETNAAAHPALLPSEDVQKMGNKVSSRSRGNRRGRGHRRGYRHKL